MQDCCKRGKESFKFVNLKLSLPFERVTKKCSNLSSATRMH